MLEPVHWYRGEFLWVCAWSGEAWFQLSHVSQGVLRSFLFEAGYCLWSQSRGMDRIIGDCATTPALSVVLMFLSFPTGDSVLQFPFYKGKKHSSPGPPAAF